MVGTEIGELDPGIGCDLPGLVVAPEVGDVDREAVAAHRRYRPQPWPVAVDRREERETIRRDDRPRQPRQLALIDRLRGGLPGHVCRPLPSRVLWLTGVSRLARK